MHIQQLIMFLCVDVNESECVLHQSSSTVWTPETLNVSDSETQTDSDGVVCVVWCLCGVLYGN